MNLNIERKTNYFFSNRDLLYLFLPLVIEQGLEYLVGLADSLMVANVGEAAVSGVSLVDFVMALIISIFAALATGGSVIAGQYLGKNEKENAQQAGNQLFKSVLYISIGLTLILYLVKPLILNNLFGSISPEVYANADVYYQVVIISVPFLALYNAGAALFRTVGNSKAPMQIMMAMNIVNVVGNALLVLVFKMGVVGIAIPTLVSRIGAAVIIMVMASKKNFELPLKNFIKLRFDGAMVKIIMNIGAPFGFESGMFHLGRLIVLSVVSLFGTAAIAANSIGGTIVMFQVLPGMAINLGLSAIIARCVGSGDYEQAKYYKKKVRKIMHVAFILSTAIVLGLMPLLMDIYNLSAETSRLVWTIVVSHGALMILIWPSGYMLPIVFRGAGDAKLPMVTSIVSMILFRIIFSYIFAVVFNFGMIGTWMAMFVDWVVKSIIFEYFDLKGRWTKFKAV